MEVREAKPGIWGIYTSVTDRHPVDLFTDEKVAFNFMRWLDEHYDVEYLARAVLDGTLTEDDHACLWEISKRAKHEARYDSSSSVYMDKYPERARLR